MNIEKFFLNTLLKISIGGVFFIIVSNVLMYPEDTLSILLSSAILFACIISYLVRQKHPTLSVSIVSIVVLSAMSYQRITVPHASTTLSIVLIIGFIISVMLKGRALWTLHCIAFLIVNTVFVYQLPDAVTAAITYSTLYFILCYATWILKSNYDSAQKNLISTNNQLSEKAKKIESQNEELRQIQENLSRLNTDLEKIVNERTAKIQTQNEILIKYSYTNAHHLRGPVARLLGLAMVYKLEPDPNTDYFINKMVEQANEIDDVVKQINIELEGTSVEMENQNRT